MVIIVDNSTVKNVDFFLELNNTKIFHLDENIGIAAAQNIGINKSIEQGADYIILSDQDTIYPVDYVEKMIEIFAFDEVAAAVAPRFIDVKKKSIDGFAILRRIGFANIYPEFGCYAIAHAIASGLIVKVSTLSDIGLMQDDLFIDWVDYEWCWRARKAGYKIIGNADVIIQHQLGDSSVDIGFREVNLRSPQRHYYITRNAFYLALYSNLLTFPQRITLFFRSFRYIIAFPILAKPHLINLKAVFLGFYHGSIGKIGRFDVE